VKTQEVVMTRKSSVFNRASTLALAIALVVGPSPAVAQSFAGTGSFTTNGGGAADITPGAQTTTITLNPGQTVIDWVPDDDAIAPGVAIPFQPANTTATFISTDDFAVLNRVNVTDTSRLISLNGTINSIVGELTGGSVFFYSPAGFVVGANAVIDVGSLVLTSSPITRPRIRENSEITSFTLIGRG
jgi:filamentous hemagglutinin family protein